MSAPDGGVRRRGQRIRIVGWGLAGGLLLLPWLAMQFTDEVNWGAGDFLFAAVLLAVVAIGLEVAVRANRHPAYRAGAAAALAAGFLLAWANAAVGIIGAETERINLMFPAIVLLALAGAAIARLRPRGLAVAMAATATAQLVALAIGLQHDFRGAVLSGGFVLLWLLSAGLFAAAARSSGD